MTDSRKRKLEELLRASARGKLLRGEDLLAAHGHTGVNRAPAPRAIEPEPLETVCPGVEVALDTPAGPGRCWLIRRPLGEVAPADAHIAAEFAGVLKGARHRFNELEASAELCHAANALPPEILFMDTETCGLGGMPIFLVGLMFYDPDAGDLIFEQYLARHYGEEPAMLAGFLQRYASTGVLVTFNGKSFDMTCLRERSAVHGFDEFWSEPPHLDLLHESRRMWKGQLPNCKLQTLERYLLGRYRSGDIPGAAIPDAYHTFVGSGDARQMRDILHHNLLDLLTMAQVLSLVLTGTDPSLGGQTR